MNNIKLFFFQSISVSEGVGGSSEPNDPPPHLDPPCWPVYNEQYM